MSVARGIRSRLASRRDAASEMAATAVDARLPENVEREGWKLKIHFTRGLDRIEAVASRFPAPLVWLSRRYAIPLVFGVWLLGVLALTTGLVLALPFLSSIEFGVDGAQPPEFPGLPELLLNILVSIPAALLLLSLMVAMMCLLTWVVFLFLVPGLLAHEFGHALALGKNGLDIESYGILLTGPIPAGAFVKPDIAGHRWAETALTDRLWVFAAGPLNDVFHVLLVVSGAWVLGMGDNYIVQAYAAAWLLNLGLNCAPFVGGVDGNKMWRTVLAWWWGFETIDIDVIQGGKIHG